MLEFVRIMLLFMSIIFLLVECFNVYKSLRIKSITPTFKYKGLLIVISISYLLTLIVI